jgi:hypothetical protein
MKTQNANHFVLFLLMLYVYLDRQKKIGFRFNVFFNVNFI